MRSFLFALATMGLMWWMGYVSGRDSVEIAHNEEEIRLLVERNLLLRERIAQVDADRTLGNDGTRDE